MTDFKAAAGTAYKHGCGSTSVCRSARLITGKGRDSHFCCQSVTLFLQVSKMYVSDVACDLVVIDQLHNCITNKINKMNIDYPQRQITHEGTNYTQNRQ